MGGNKKNDLLNICKKGDRSVFPKYEEKEVNHEEYVERLSQKDFSTLSEGLLEFLKSFVEDEAIIFEDQEEDAPAEVIMSQEFVSFLKITSAVVKAFIQDTKRKVPDALGELVSGMHDILIAVNRLKPELANDMSAIFEMWWIQERPGKESLAPQTISFLVYKALDDGKVMDVQRVHALRSTLLLIDFLDESATSLKRLLLRCLIHPNFLKNKKGQLFLVYLFGLSPPFVDELHMTIKAQVPTSRKSILEAYGNIYYKAWKAASGPYLLKLEYTCIQDLMTNAIHVATPQIVAGIRRILGIFNANKKVRGVDQMLLRLYEPILWRNLKVSNHIVRKNAAMLLIDAFPLNDPDARQKDTDQLLQKQFDVLQMLLYDESIEVRIVGVQGVCRIMGVYWELIPEATLHTLMANMINDLVYDATSAAVRVAVLEGLQYLLDNHLTQPLLKVVLPKLNNVLHDKTEKVRSVFIDLLVTIRSLKFIKYYEVVQVEHLLERLAVDSDIVGTKISELILNSYFPADKSCSIQLKRCILLLNANPRAATNFYKHLPSHVPTALATKFVGAIFSYLSNVIEGEQETDLTDLNPLATIMSCLCQSLNSKLKLQENESLRESLYEIITDDKVESLVESDRLAKSKSFMLKMLSQVPKDSVPTMSTMCLDTLTHARHIQVEDFEEIELGSNF
eukprot:TRINITY_DN11343_c0_g1_i1.p1 TRINITY_DN11343_c0_g1~~TRINITY_DN11343_c0_g1_i1.p1  ORF type:complete len:679 (-),score=214.77 TRINITY_DN11343_c0_g1_i1:86-2122(-)